MKTLEWIRASGLGLWMLLLVGCGSSVYDCASGEVVDTVREALVDEMGDKAYKARIAESVEINGIAMLEVDKDTNEYTCKADFSYESPTGETASNTMGYGVRQIVSDDAEFEITYEERAFRNFVYAAVDTEMRQDIKERQAAADKAQWNQTMASLKRLSRADATAQLVQRYTHAGNPPTIVPTQLDPERDDVEDYVVMAPWYGAPNGEAEQRQTHLLTCVQQVARGQGEPMELFHSSVEALPKDVVPTEIKVVGSEITVSTTTGESLSYSCSNSYISRNHLAT